MNHSSSLLIMSGATVVGTYGEKQLPLRTPKRSFQLRASGTGTLTVEIFASDVPVPNEANDGDWISVGTISLAPAGSPVSDGFTTDAPWKYVRAKLTAQTGTASADVYMGG
jgi:hypothetical protein